MRAAIELLFDPQQPCHLHHSLADRGLVHAARGNRPASRADLGEARKWCGRISEVTVRDRMTANIDASEGETLAADDPGRAVEAFGSFEVASITSAPPTCCSGGGAFTKTGPTRLWPFGTISREFGSWSRNARAFVKRTTGFPTSRRRPISSTRRSGSWHGAGSSRELSTTRRGSGLVRFSMLRACSPIRLLEARR